MIIIILQHLMFELFLSFIIDTYYLKKLIFMFVLTFSVGFIIIDNNISIEPNI